MLGSVELFVSEYVRIDAESKTSSSRIDPALSFGERNIEGKDLLDELSPLIGKVVCIVLHDRMITATLPFYVILCMSLLQAREYVKLPNDLAAMHFCKCMAVLDGTFIDGDTADIVGPDARHFFGEIASGTYSQQQPSCVIEISMYLGDENGSGVDSTVFTCIMPMKPQKEGEYIFPRYEDDPKTFKSIVRKLAPNVAKRCSGSEERWAETSSLIDNEFSSIKTMKLEEIEDKLQGDLLTSHQVWASANKKRVDIIRQCWGCGLRQFRLKKCGRCRKALYCNAKCQKKDWKSHKKACTLHQ